MLISTGNGTEVDYCLEDDNDRIKMYEKFFGKESNLLSEGGFGMIIQNNDKKEVVKIMKFKTNWGLNNANNEIGFMQMFEDVNIVKIVPKSCLVIKTLTAIKE